MLPRHLQGQIHGNYPIGQNLGGDPCKRGLLSNLCYVQERLEAAAGWEALMHALLVQCHIIWLGLASQAPETGKGCPQLGNAGGCVQSLVSVSLPLCYTIPLATDAQRPVCCESCTAAVMNAGLCTRGCCFLPSSERPPGQPLRSRRCTKIAVLFVLCRQLRLRSVHQQCWHCQQRIGACSTGSCRVNQGISSHIKKHALSL